MKKQKNKKVKVWAWFCKVDKPVMFKEEFGTMYATEKEALKFNCKGDIVIPVIITYQLPTPKKSKKKSKKLKK